MQSTERYKHTTQPVSLNLSSDDGFQVSRRAFYVTYMSEIEGSVNKNPFVPKAFYSFICNFAGLQVSIILITNNNEYEKKEFTITIMGESFANDASMSGRVCAI